MREGAWLDWLQEWEDEPEPGEGLFPSRERHHEVGPETDSESSEYEYRYLQSEAKYVKQSYVLDEDGYMQNIFTVSTPSERSKVLGADGTAGLNQ